MMAYDLCWTTYTSCEGHYYGHNGLHPVERHVGVLPRTEAERQTILSKLTAVSVKVNSRLLLGAVRVEVIVHSLQSNEMCYPAIDLFFKRRRLHSWQSYFKSLEGVYAKVTQDLRGLTHG